MDFGGDPIFGARSAGSGSGSEYCIQNTVFGIQNTVFGIRYSVFVSWLDLGDCSELAHRLKKLPERKPLGNSEPS